MSGCSCAKTNFIYSTRLNVRLMPVPFEIGCTILIIFIISMFLLFICSTFFRCRKWAFGKSAHNFRVHRRWCEQVGANHLIGYCHWRWNETTIFIIIFVNWCSLNSDGLSPLDVAVLSNNRSLTKMLLQNGAIEGSTCKLFFFLTTT